MTFLFPSSFLQFSNGIFCVRVFFSSFLPVYVFVSLGTHGYLFYSLGCNPYLSLSILLKLSQIWKPRFSSQLTSNVTLPWEKAQNCAHFPGLLHKHQLLEQMSTFSREAWTHFAGCAVRHLHPCSSPVRFSYTELSWQWFAFPSALQNPPANILPPTCFPPGLFPSFWLRNPLILQIRLSSIPHPLQLSAQTRVAS